MSARPMEVLGLLERLVRVAETFAEVAKAREARLAGKKAPDQPRPKLGPMTVEEVAEAKRTLRRLGITPVGEDPASSPQGGRSAG